MIIRKAAQEGRFYPAGKERIYKQISEIIASNRYQVKEIPHEMIFGAILPHAGHIYSGYQTVPFFQWIQKFAAAPETFIIVHPNHTGRGLPVALDEAETWRNSIGDVSVDRGFGLALDMHFDNLSHEMEHSAEVIIPFLQYFFPDHDFSILPICMLDQSYESASLVAQRIVDAVRLTGRKIMVLASCDFSHYLTPEQGEAMDQKIIDQILSRNSRGVETVVKRDHVSACGYGPVMALMEYAAKVQPGYLVEILARGHSGEVIPSREVVDYVSMILYQ